MMKPPIIDLRHGDCMDLMRDAPDGFYDLAIVDIPYGIGADKPTKKPNSAKQKNGTMLSVKPSNYAHKGWDVLPGAAYVAELKRVSKNQIVFGGNYIGLSGGYFVWDKLNGLSDQFSCELAYQSFSNRTDTVYFMWSGMMHGVYCGRDVRKALIQQGDKSKNEKRIHPTQKPVALYKWLLTNYAKPGDRILDTHGGSMSIAIACYDLGFDLTLIELDKQYYDAGVGRFEGHVAKGNLFYSDHQKNLSLRHG